MIKKTLVIIKLIDTVNTLLAYTPYYTVAEPHMVAYR